MTLTKTDRFGDGWNGNLLNVYFREDHEQVHSTTLDKLYTGSEVVCLQLDSCFDVTCGGGAYREEIDWTIENGGGVVANGGGNGEANRIIAGFCTCKDEESEYKALGIGRNPLGMHCGGYYRLMRANDFSKCGQVAELLGEEGCVLGGGFSQAQVEDMLLFCQGTCGCLI